MQQQQFQQQQQQQHQGPGPVSHLLQQKLKPKIHIVLARYKESLDHWLRCIPWLANDYDITVWIMNKFYTDASTDEDIENRLKPYVRSV